MSNVVNLKCKLGTAVIDYDHQVVIIKRINLGEYQVPFKSISGIEFREGTLFQAGAVVLITDNVRFTNPAVKMQQYNESLMATWDPQHNESCRKIVEELSEQISVPLKGYKKFNVPVQHYNRQFPITDLSEETRVICNTCGKLFCYTENDLLKNERNASVQKSSALSGALGVTFGNRMLGEANLTQSLIAGQSVKDYNKCPYCNSTNISRLTEDEWKSKNQSNNASVDDILKFKQLLDAGVISQEEFDAKKKQLLGL